MDLIIDGKKLEKIGPADAVKFDTLVRLVFVNDEGEPVVAFDAVIAPI